MDKNNKASNSAKNIMQALADSKHFDKETGIATVPRTGKSDCFRFLQILQNLEGNLMVCPDFALKSERQPDGMSGFCKFHKIWKPT